MGCRGPVPPALTTAGEEQRSGGGHVRDTPGSVSTGKNKTKKTKNKKLVTLEKTTTEKSEKEVTLKNCSVLAID